MISLGREDRMSKLEALVDTVCGTGVLLTPVWLIYKVSVFLFS